MDLPYLTKDFPGIGGVIKQRPEDFFVQELPLYEPSGQGEHVYCEIQKLGISTFQAIDRIAKALGIPPRDVGYAGMKDAQALTRQVLSLRGTTEQLVADLQLPDLQVLWAARHVNKLRLGHLRGNRFAVKIRQVDPAAVVRLRPAVQALQQQGMPNYFGEQRFGRRGDNSLLGAALIRGDDEGLVRLLLGNPNPETDDPPALQARQAFEQGDLEKSLGQWPRGSDVERKVLARLHQSGRADAAVRAIDERLRRLWVSALQSDMFNQVVAKRIDSLGRLLEGDLAWKHENGAVFRVEQPAVEQPRADRFEISPSGPLIGYRMTLPAGEALSIEEQVLAASGLRPEDFRQAGRHKISGARRPLRVRPEDVELAAGVDEYGAHVTVAFSLPAGSFATTLLRELMK